VEEDGRVPLIDIGTLARIRDGSIGIYGGIDHLSSDGVAFADGRHATFDAIILATGFRPDLRQLIPDVEGVFDRHGMPLVTGQATAAPGLYFCGQITSPTGQLREIGIEAQQIADAAGRYPAAAHFAAR
jgi:NAD(P)H-nitrite reductase large subunit